MMRLGLGVLQFMGGGARRIPLAIGLMPHSANLVSQPVEFGWDLLERPDRSKSPLRPPLDHDLVEDSPTDLPFPAQLDGGQFALPHCVH